MDRETVIDMVRRHIEHCKKYDEKFSTFTVEACKDILYYLENKTKDKKEK